MPLTLIAFWIVYVAGVAGAMIVPLLGVLLYIVVYHINPEAQWWGESIRATGFRTSMTVALATVCGLILRWPRFQHSAKQLVLPVPIMLLFAVVATASLSWGFGYSARGAFQAEKLIKVLIFVMILIRCVREPQHYHAIMLTWLCGIFYLGYQAWGHVGVHSSGRLVSGLGGPDFAESSDIAVHLVAALPLIGAMFFMARRWWTRTLVGFIGALAVNTIIMTRTRGAMIGLVVMCIVIGFSLPRGFRLRGWVAMALACLAAVQLADPGFWERMRTISLSPHDTSAAQRLTYWAAAVRMAADYPLGIGIGNFQEVVKSYVPGLTIVRSAHNTFFECLAELGYPGLFILLAILFVLFLRLGKIRSAADRDQIDMTIAIVRWKARFHLGWHAMALRAALAGYVACAMFTTRLWAEGFWILIGMACALTNVAAFVRDEAALAETDAAVRPEPETAASTPLPLPAIGVAP